MTILTKMTKRLEIESVWNSRVTRWDYGKHGVSQCAKVYALDQDGRVWLHQPFGASETEVMPWEGTIEGLTAKMRAVGYIDTAHWKCVAHTGDDPDWTKTTAAAEYVDVNG